MSGISLLEIVLLSLVGFVAFRMGGQVLAGGLFFVYAVFRITWAMAGVSVERERLEKEKWLREHPDEVYAPPAGVVSVDYVRSLWRQLLALARRADRVGKQD